MKPLHLPGTGPAPIVRNMLKAERYATFSLSSMVVCVRIFRARDSPTDERIHEKA